MDYKTLILYYILPIAFILWFTGTTIALQRERNKLLKSIHRLLNKEDVKSD